MPSEIDLLAVDRGSVTAPAGCGKTQQIAEALGAHGKSKPILVLTHTNAGVAALRIRLALASVPSSAYRVVTIDGFAMRLVAKFPQRSGLPPATLELANPSQDYPAIRAAAARLLQTGHITQSLKASYARLLVDEYQDCNLSQHSMITWAAQVLPTCVLGDPMQAVFSFAGNTLVNWQTDVEAYFPSAGVLHTPWRWQRAGTPALGHWLLDVRKQLQAGRSVDLQTAPSEVQWVQLQTATADAQRRQAAMVRCKIGQDSVLVIGDCKRPARRNAFASQTPGTTVVERVDLPELIKFARSFGPTAADPLAILVEFAASVMTGVGAVVLLERVRILRFGRPRVPASPIEANAVAFANAPSFVEARRLLLALSRESCTRIYRPELLYSCQAALQAARGPDGLYAAALQIREKQRYTNQTQSRRRVGSTLLLKGLEADVAVILEPQEMTAQHLYVAMTRGARQLIVCSPTSVLIPAQ
jgi:hypothetical protein